MYVPVAQRNKPTTKTGYIPVAQRQTTQVQPKLAPQVFYTPKSTEVGMRDVIRELPTGAKRVGSFLKEFVAPPRGYTEKELKAAKPTTRELISGVPKVVAEFSSAIGNLLASSDRSLASKFAQTALGGKLAGVGAKIEEFGKPKNVGEAKAMRIADVVSFVPMGTMKVSLTGAQTIARTKNLRAIVGVLKKEIPDLSDEAAESFGRVFVDIDNADEIQRAVNKIDISVSNARNTTKGASYTPVAQRQTPETIARQDFDASWKAAYGNRPSKIEAPSQLQQRKIAGKPNIDAPLTPKPIDPLLTEARKYKSAEEFVKGGDTLPTDIVLGMRRAKGTRTESQVAELADSIIREGIKRPIALELKDGALEIADGVHRTEIAKRINLTEVPVEIYVKENGALRKLTQTEQKSQLTSIWKKAQGGIQKQLPTPPGLPKLTRTTDQTISGTTGIGRTVPQKIQTPETAAKRPVLHLDTEKVSRQVQEVRTTLPESVPQASRIVKEDSPAVRLSNESYEANHARMTQKTGRIQRIKENLGAATRSVGEGADKLLGTISTRLKNIDPSLKKAIRDLEFNLANNTQKDRKAVAPFLKAMRSKDISLRDYADLDLALKNGDAVKTQEILTKYGLENEFASVRATLEDLYRRAESVGYDIGYEQNYFPRMIEDSSGLLEYLQKGDDWSIIDEAIRAKETELGRYLSVDEKASVINTLVRGYPTGKVTLSETGAMKARRIDIVDAELNQFYRDSVESLLRYVDSTNDAIEARRFFGKGKTTDEFANVEDSIGSYILNLMADGKVKPSQEKELGEILRARFVAKGTSGITRVYKNLSYIDTMGSVTSAITQLGDLAFAIYKGGPVRAAKAFGKAIIGKSELTRADIGIEKIAQEFQDSSRSANAVTRVFKLIGLEKLDALGKETVINASINRFRALAEEPTVEFIRKVEAVFGNDADTLTRVIEDLKAGKITEDTKLLAFNELLDVQPVALSEMPEMYLKGGNGRIFYMLKTYTIKLFDVYRNEVFSQMRTNPVQATRNLLYLTGSLLLMNATADEIKDLILNRETSLKDRTVDNILKLAGFSKFTIYKAREEGIGSAVAKTILPPFKFIDSAYKDITQANEVSQLETIQSIPLAGKLYYWWFGKGATKTEKKRKAGSGSGGNGRLKTPPGLPELPSLKSTLPPLPKLPALSL